MKYKFVFDIHEGSTMQIAKCSDFKWDQADIIYGADNIDMTNCKKSMVNHYQELIYKLKNILGDRFLTGNHCAQRDSDRLYKIPNTRVGVMHGDLIFWGKEKSQKYRNKKHGAGFLKRGLWVNALEALENGYDRKVNDDDLERFHALCLIYDVDRIIVGHLHPKRQIDIFYKGKHLTICQRGLTELEV